MQQKFAMNKALEQKLIGPMEESHTKQQSPETVSKMELRAKRSKSTGLRAITRERERERERERATVIFSRGRW